MPLNAQGTHFFQMTTLILVSCLLLSCLIDFKNRNQNFLKCLRVASECGSPLSNWWRAMASSLSFAQLDERPWVQPWRPVRSF